MTKDEQQELKQNKIAILSANKERVTGVLEMPDYYDKMDALVNENET